MLLLCSDGAWPAGQGEKGCACVARVETEVQPERYKQEIGLIEAEVDVALGKLDEEHPDIVKSFKSLDPESDVKAAARQLCRNIVESMLRERERLREEHCVCVCPSRRDASLDIDTEGFCKTCERYVCEYCFEFPCCIAETNLPAAVLDEIDRHMGGNKTCKGKLPNLWGLDTLLATVAEWRDALSHLAEDHLEDTEVLHVAKNTSDEKDDATSPRPGSALSLVLMPLFTEVLASLPGLQAKAEELQWERALHCHHRRHLGNHKAVLAADRAVRCVTRLRCRHRSVTGAESEREYVLSEGIRSTNHSAAETRKASKSLISSPSSTTSKPAAAVPAKELVAPAAPDHAKSIDFSSRVDSRGGVPTQTRAAKEHVLPVSAPIQGSPIIPSTEPSLISLDRLATLPHKPTFPLPSAYSPVISTDMSTDMVLPDQVGPQTGITTASPARTDSFITQKPRPGIRSVDLSITARAATTVPRAQDDSIPAAQLLLELSDEDIPVNEEVWGGLPPEGGNVGRARNRSKLTRSQSFVGETGNAPTGRESHFAWGAAQIEKATAEMLANESNSQPKTGTTDAMLGGLTKESGQMSRLGVFSFDVQSQAPTEPLLTHQMSMQPRADSAPGGTEAPSSPAAKEKTLVDMKEIAVTTTAPETQLLAPQAQRARSLSLHNSQIQSDDKGARTVESAMKMTAVERQLSPGRSINEPRSLVKTFFTDECFQALIGRAEEEGDIEDAEIDSDSEDGDAEKWKRAMAQVRQLPEESSSSGEGSSGSSAEGESSSEDESSSILSVSSPEAPQTVAAAIAQVKAQLPIMPEEQTGEPVQGFNTPARRTPAPAAGSPDSALRTQRSRSSVADVPKPQSASRIRGTPTSYVATVVSDTDQLDLNSVLSEDEVEVSAIRSTVHVVRQGDAATPERPREQALESRLATLSPATLQHSQKQPSTSSQSNLYRKAPLSLQSSFSSFSFSTSNRSQGTRNVSPHTASEPVVGDAPPPQSPKSPLSQGEPLRNDEKHFSGDVFAAAMGLHEPPMSPEAPGARGAVSADTESEQLMLSSETSQRSSNSQTVVVERRLRAAKTQFGSKFIEETEDVFISTVSQQSQPLSRIASLPPRAPREPIVPPTPSRRAPLTPQSRGSGLSLPRRHSWSTQLAGFEEDIEEEPSELEEDEEEALADDVVKLDSGPSPRHKKRGPAKATPEGGSEADVSVRDTKPYFPRIRSKLPASRLQEAPRRQEAVCVIHLARTLAATASSLAGSDNVSITAIELAQYIRDDLGKPEKNE